MRNKFAYSADEARALMVVKPSKKMFKDFGVGDVHVAAAGGDGKPKKKKPGEFRVPMQVAKYVPDQQLIFGWASVVEKDGKLIVDKQGDMILPEDLESAAYEFCLEAQEPTEKKVLAYLGKHAPRTLLKVSLALSEGFDKKSCLGDMHESMDMGRLVESVVFTKEKQEALGVDLGKIGWWVGFKVDSPDLWAAHKRGERPEFSIGGYGQREDVEKYNPHHDERGRFSQADGFGGTSLNPKMLSSKMKTWVNTIEAKKAIEKGLSGVAVGMATYAGMEVVTNSITHLAGIDAAAMIIGVKVVTDKIASHLGVYEIAGKAEEVLAGSLDNLIHLRFMQTRKADGEDEILAKLKEIRAAIKGA